jgi:NAD(P)-dependent dehydrogenase (short-subunit alcohol dehydrogenase family)
MLTSSTTGKISLLALNAGVSARGSWPDADYFHKILSVNLFGIIHGLNSLLPLVTSHSSASSPSSIVITGSKQGITNPPGNPAYNASKAAVKTLAEHLSFDLSKSSPTTSVHLLVPGWTFTGLSGNNSSSQEKKEKPKGAWWPDQVVSYMEEKMSEGRFYIICPDNDVSEEMDKKRMLWDRLDLVEGRPPLTRWREDYEKEAEEWMRKERDV